MIGKTNATVGGGVQLKSILSTPFTAPNSTATPPFHSVGQCMVFSPDSRNSVLLPIFTDAYVLPNYLFSATTISMGSGGGTFKITLDQISGILNELDLTKGRYRLHLCFMSDAVISEDNMPTSTMVWYENIDVYITIDSNGLATLDSSHCYIKSGYNSRPSDTGRLFLLGLTHMSDY